MRFGPCDKASRAWLAGAVLLAFALRALVPPGFMPGGERPFSIEICPDGFPAQLLAHHHHGGAADTHEAHCVFAVCAHGGLAHSSPFTGISLERFVVAAWPVEAVPVIHLVHLPYPRGPPSAA
jgi:hypothetical protein